MKCFRKKCSNRSSFPKRRANRNIGKYGQRIVFVLVYYPVTISGKKIKAAMQKLRARDGKWARGKRRDINLHKYATFGVRELVRLEGKHREPIFFSHRIEPDNTTLDDGKIR